MLVFLYTDEGFPKNRLVLFIDPSDVVYLKAVTWHSVVVFVSFACCQWQGSRFVVIMPRNYVRRNYTDAGALKNRLVLVVTPLDVVYLEAFTWYSAVVFVSLVFGIAQFAFIYLVSLSVHQVYLYLIVFLTIWIFISLSSILATLLLTSFPFTLYV